MLDDTYGGHLSQEHDGQGLPIAFPLHTFMETQQNWSTPKQETYGLYYAVTKWTYYLQDLDIIMCNNHKPLQKFLNGKNAINKVKPLVTVVEVPEHNAQVASILVNATTAVPAYGPATHTLSKT